MPATYATYVSTTQIGKKSLFWSSLLYFSFRTTIKVTLTLCHDEVASYVSASGLTFTFVILSQRRKCLKIFFCYSEHSCLAVISSPDVIHHPTPLFKIKMSVCVMELCRLSTLSAMTFCVQDVRKG